MTEVIEPGELCELLGAVHPAGSPLDGPTSLLVDGDWGAVTAPPTGGAEPSVPVIGRLRGSVPGSAATVLERCDVLIGDTGTEAGGAVAGGEEALDTVAAAVAAHPVAASVLCQLLRRSGDLDVATGLLAESLAYSTLQAGTDHRSWLEGRDRHAPRIEDEGPAVRGDRAGELLTVQLNRPHVHNALGVAVRDELVEWLDLARADRSITSVVLTGAGPSFCSGGDLREFGTAPDPATGHAVRSLRLPARSLARIADRVRVVVHGASVGAGVELAAFAWEVEARVGASFRLPEVAMGLIPGSGGTVSLPRRIGRQRTGWLALTGTELTVDQALAWGLVDRVTSDATPRQ